MFVSYMFTRHNEIMFGYMCFTGMVPKDKLTEYIQKTLFVKVILIICMTKYTDSKIKVLFYNKHIGLEIIDYNKPLSNVGQIGGLYTMLYRKYGFCNILKFI